MITPPLRPLAALALATLLAACAQQPPLHTLPAALTQPAPLPTAVSAEAAPAAAPVDETSAPRLIKGDDQVIAPAQPVPPLTGAPLTFNFEEAPIAEVVRAVLGDILKQPYVLHPPITGTVTLVSKSAIPPDQAVFLLESALQANGLAMVRDARGTYHIGRADALRTIGAAVRQAGNGAPLAPGYGAIVVPLQYIGAGEMATILRPLAPEGAIVRVDTVRNLLVLVGTRSQAEGWLDLVHTFDVNLLKGMSVGLFPLKYASIKEVEAALAIVSGSPAPAAPAAGAPAAPAAARAATATGAPAASAASALGEANPLFGALRVMPIERLNAILIVTPRAAYLEEARRWIDKLDQPGGGGGEPGLHIYKVQNGNATHLANVLSGIFGGTSTGNAPVANSGVAPGLASGTRATFGQPVLGQSAFGGGFGSSGNTFGQGGTGAGTGFGSAFGQSRTQANAQPQQTGSVTSIGGVRVMADSLNNSILVWSTQADYAKIETSLKRLDLPPTQVLIEATIIEVTLSDDLKYGLQWAFTDSHRRGPGAGLIGQVPGASAGGFSYTLTDSLGNLRVTLNALADKSLIKVISSPSLMVLDNQVATMAVGTQQPIRTGETNYLNTGGINQGTPITTNYQYKDTGVQLQVQPSVNSGDLVTMDINQTVTDVGDQDTTTGQRTFLQRQIASKVAVRSGQAIVLGGLIKDNASTGKSGVPLLQDIPILGHLFGATTTNNARTELLVVITPKVVRTDPEIRQVSEELRERLQGLKLLQPPSATETP